MFPVTQEQFEQAVADAIDSLPENFFADMDNVVILVDDEPSDEQLENLDCIWDDGFESSGYATESGDLLGLYEGMALTDRGTYYGAGEDLPDTITIFKGPHERLCNDREEFVEEVRRTVVHEVAHYFGLDEDQVDEMGYA